jgi:hypothetical protein
MKKFFQSMFSEGGEVSSKRVVTAMCLLFMLVAFTSNLFCDYTVEQHMFESLQWIVMAGLGFTASEKFSEIISNRKNQNHE